MKINRKNDLVIGIIIIIVSLTLIVTILNSDELLNWAYKRHQNQLSFYIRPLLLLPYCWFAYKKSISGMAISFLMIMTSMFWFNEPAEPNEDVALFLEMEKNWIKQPLTWYKTLEIMLIPITFFLLALTFWTKNIFVGYLIFSTSILMKILWSVDLSNEGYVIIIPAVMGIALAGIFIWKWQNKKDSTH